MGYLERALIGTTNVVNERIDLVRSHEFDRHMLARGALEDRTHGINVPDVRGNHLLSARLRGKTAENAWAGMRERAHLGLPPMFDERLGERAFVDQKVRIAG